MSSFGGVYDSSSNVNTHYNLSNVGNITKETFSADSNSSHVVYSDLDFPFCADEFSGNEFDRFEVHSNEFLERDNDNNQQVVCEHFHGIFCSLVTNPLFEECEGVLEHVKSNQMSNKISNEEKSDSMYPSYPVTQGEFQIHDICDSLNQEKYESFVFPLDGMHK